MRTPEECAWHAMWQRCTNPRGKSWRRYGGRGIMVCDRWRSLADFLQDMGPRPSPQHSLDRIDNDGNYEPDNCRWATRVEQALNKMRPAAALPLPDSFIFREAEYHRLATKPRRLWTKRERAWFVAALSILTRGLPEIPVEHGHR